MARDTVAFISYARQDGEEFATTLRQRLEREEHEITLWQDRTRMEGGVDFEEQIRRAIDAVQFLILVMTPAAMRSKWVEKEWRYAREQGVCVCPVAGAPEADLQGPRQQLPRWMSQAHMYDLDHEWTRFVNFLKSPCQATRVPFMADDLPTTFIERPTVLAKILDNVLDQEHKNPSAKTVALYGSPGFGKTALALNACHHGDVMAACDGGILWATLGEQPSVVRELTKLYAALTNERPQFLDADDAAIEFAKKLEGKRCLIVIDDIWDLEHARPFLRGGDQCTRLLTTRNARIAAEIAEESRRISIGELETAQAERLLTARLTARPADMTKFRALAARLGNWPILLELAGSTLYEQIIYGESTEGALAWVNEALDRFGVVAFDREDAHLRNQAIAKTIEVSLSLLKDNRQRSLELAIFPEDVDVPLTMVGCAWGTDDLQTRRLAQRMNELSIIKLNLAGSVLRLHDAMRDYLATQLTDAAHLHGRVADAWQDPARMWQDPARIAVAYARRYAVYHLVESMLDRHQVHARGLRLVRLLTSRRFQEYQQQQGDLVVLHRQLAKAVERAAESSAPQSAAMMAALAVAARSYSVAKRPGWLFELALEGKVDDAEVRLDLFDAEPEWMTAARLTIAWLAAERNPADARALTTRTAAACDRPELRSLLAWVQEAPDGVPPGVVEIQGGPDLYQVASILERAGGVEGSSEGIEPLRASLLASGLSDTAGFLAEDDGPPLVAFARKDPPSHTQYLRQYIAIHAANKYRYYRNRSLWMLLKPVLEYPEAAWVRMIVEELVTSALTVTSIDFQDALPLTVMALKARADNQNAAQQLTQYAQRLCEEAALLSPLRGKSDSWTYYQRRASGLAEIYATMMGQSAEAARFLQLAQDLPQGFAGYRAYAALTLAEAMRIVHPDDHAMMETALASAQAAAHRIQDYPFCLQATARVNAMRSRWGTAGMPVEEVIKRFLKHPRAPEFCAVHRILDPFAYRVPNPHTIPLPPHVRSASTLRAVASAYRLNPVALQNANPDCDRGLDDRLEQDTEVNIPDDDFIPLLAARFAAEVLAAKAAKVMTVERSLELIQSLVPLAAPNPTTLDTVLSRLLLASSGITLELPDVLTALVPSTFESSVATRGTW
jgi:hypothetical protein